MDNMLMESFQDYWLSISAIEAEEALMQLNIVSFPNMKKGSRDSLIKELKKSARFNLERETDTVLSIEDAALQLAAKMKYG
jgi:hypothetical protein